MATRIISMGVLHGPSPEGAPLIHVTTFANPYSNPTLRELTGKNVVVQDYIRCRTKNYSKKFDQLVAICNQLQGDVYLACYGGRHRSVCLAELVAERLNIPFSHRDIDKADR